MVHENVPHSMPSTPARQAPSASYVITGKRGRRPVAEVEAFRSALSDIAIRIQPATVRQIFTKL